MKVASISNFRKEIKRYVGDVDQDQEPLIVTGADNISVVVIPLATFNSYTETDYLLQSPANASRLRESATKARAGQIDRRKLIEI
jgi:antitoxin YefM